MCHIARWGVVGRSACSLFHCLCYYLVYVSLLSSYFVLFHAGVPSSLFVVLIFFVSSPLGLFPVFLVQASMFVWDVWVS